MGTRSGDVDFGALAHVARRRGMDVTELEHMLNRDSGLLGLSELSSDCRELEAAAAAGHDGARTALAVFAHSIARHVGGLAMSLPRVDALVFTGGIGENSVKVRSDVVSRLKALGLLEDKTANADVRNRGPPRHRARPGRRRRRHPDQRRTNDRARRLHPDRARSQGSRGSQGYGSMSEFPKGRALFVVPTQADDPISDIARALVLLFEEAGHEVGRVKPVAEAGEDSDRPEGPFISRRNAERMIRQDRAADLLDEVVGIVVSAPPAPPVHGRGRRIAAARPHVAERPELRDGPGPELRRRAVRVRRGRTIRRT